MKKTGIVCPLDSLGRMVLPKELRKKLDIKAADPLEIYTEDGKIILRKCQPSEFHEDEKIISLLDRRTFNDSVKSIRKSG